MFGKILGLLKIAIILTIVSGCSHLEPREASPQEVNAFLERTKDPRVYGMHSYPNKREVRLSNSNRAHDFGKEIFRFKKGKNALGAPTFLIMHDNIPILRVLYDSTTPHTWVPLNLARELELFPMGMPDTYTTQSYHTAERESAFTAMRGKFHLNSISVENPIFQVIPKMNTLGSTTRGLIPEPDAIIGNELLSNFSTVQISFAGRWIQFGPGIQFKPEATTLVAEESLQRYKGALAVKAEMDGYSGYFIIDTVGDFGIAMKTPSRETVQFKMDDWYVDSVPVSNFADLGIPEDSLPRIGRQLLIDCRMTLDFRNNKAFFEKH